MDSLIETFHINWQTLIGQMVNFGIVFVVLWFFALKPLMKVMQERTKKIEKSLADAKQIEENLLQSEEARVAKMMEAKKEAQKILEQASARAEKTKDEMIIKAKEEVGKVVIQGKEQLARDKEEIMKQAKAEIVNLSLLVAEKVLGRAVDKKADAKLAEEVLKEIK